MLPDPQPPERHHHGDLRRALLEARAEALAEAGPEALSLRDLARRVGVSHSAAAPHFGDKRGLLTALAAEGSVRLGADLAAAVAAHRSPRAGLIASGAAYLAFAERHPGLFRLCFSAAYAEAADPALASARNRAISDQMDSSDRISCSRKHRL